MNRTTTSRARWLTLLAVFGTFASLTSLAAVIVSRRVFPPLPSLPLPDTVTGRAVIAPAPDTTAPPTVRTEAQRAISALCAFAAIVLAIYAALRYQFPHTLLTTLPSDQFSRLYETALAQGTAASILAAFALGMSLLLARRPALPTLAQTWAMMPSIRLRYLFPGLLLMALLAEINGGQMNIAALENVSQHVQAALLVCGVVLVTLGLMKPHPPAPSLQVERGSRTERDGSEAAPLWRREWVIVGAITLLAFALNIWQLEDAVHIFVDEFHFADAVARLWDEPNTKILSQFGWIASFPWTFPYLQQATSVVFTPSLTSLRIVSAVMGALMIPAVYLLAKMLFNRKTALTAALLLACLPPQLHFSRLGLNNIADPLFGVWALALLARGMRLNSRASYAAGGAMIGLTQYWYEGGRLLFPALALLWLVGTFALNGGFQAMWRHFGGLVVAVLAAVIIGAPVYYAWAGQNLTSTPRLNDKIIDFDYYREHPDEYFRNQIRPPLLHFVSTVDGSRMFYGGQTPMLLVYTTPLFLLGVGYCLWRARSPGALLLLLWCALTVMGNSLLYQNDWTARFVVVFPALALVGAVGLLGTLALVWPERKPLPVADAPVQRSVPAPRTAVTVLLVGALCVLQVVYYFGPHLSYYNLQLRPIKDHIDVVYRSRDFPPDTKIFIIGDDLVWEDHYRILGAFWDFKPTITWIKPGDFNVEFIVAQPQDVDLAFYIEPEDLGTWRLLKEYYAVGEGAFSPYNVPSQAQYVLYYVEGNTDWSQVREAREAEAP